MTKSFSRFVSITITASALALSACAGPAGIPPMTNAQTGAMVGAVLGGVAGNQFGKGDGKTAATILGTMLGSYVGSQYGARFDANDQQYLNQALYSGRPAAWRNPSTGYSYNVTPGQVYQANYNNQTTTCRPVTVAANMDGRLQNVQMRACQGANGQWYAAN